VRIGSKNAGFGRYSIIRHCARSEALHRLYPWRGEDGLLMKDLIENAVFHL